MSFVRSEQASVKLFSCKGPGKIRMCVRGIYNNDWKGAHAAKCLLYMWDGFV